MNETPPSKIIAALLDRFESSQIMIVLFGLWTLYAIFPDPIPFIDEIILGILTLQTARWASRTKKENAAKAPAEDSTKPPMKNVTPPREKSSEP